MGPGGYRPSAWRNVMRRIALLLLVVCSCEAAWSQDAPAPEEKAAYTLHAYANLVQVPVLILNSSRGRLKETIASNRLFVSIDSGPWFRATHARPEGDDPISISILLDVRGQALNLMDRVDKDLESLAPASLHSRDLVSLYSLDCGVVRTLDTTPANPELLRRGGAELMRLRRNRVASHERCAQQVSLEETLLYLASQTNNQTGRRILLVVSDGADDNSKVPWRQIAETAQLAGTAIFAISPQPAPSTVIQPVRGMRIAVADSAPQLDETCQLSGGTMVTTYNSGLAGALGQVLGMVRERYVVDFPRPTNATAGRHTLEIRVDKGVNFVRPAGISVPIADPATLADPTTVPSDPSIAPVQGKRSAVPR